MEVFVASLDITDIIHGGKAFRRHCCQYQCSTCPQIRCGNIRSGISGYTVNDGGIALYFDIGSHTGQFIYIFEPVLENTLGHDAGPLGQSQCHGDLRLHICGESRIGQSLHLGMLQRLGCHHADTVIRLLYFTADLQQLRRNGLQMLGNHIFHRDIALGHRCREHKCARLDLVGDHGILGTVQMGHTFDTDHIRTGALDVGSHTVQKVRQVYHMGLLR